MVVATNLLQGESVGWEQSGRLHPLASFGCTGASVRLAPGAAEAFGGVFSGQHWIRAPVLYLPVQEGVWIRWI